jgi:hypothetical protein
MFTIEVETLRLGQAKAYEHSYYEYVITCPNWFPTEQHVRWLAKAIRGCRQFADELDSSVDTTEKYFTPQSNKWHILIVEHYTD